MNKAELVKEVAGRCGLTQSDASKALDATIQVITETLKSDAGITNEKNRKGVTITGFGTFHAKHREAREGRNPATGAKVKISAKDSASWKPAAALKDL